jgi:excisionase family DNA binding protein
MGVKNKMELVPQKEHQAYAKQALKSASHLTPSQEINNMITNLLEGIAKGTTVSVETKVRKSEYTTHEAAEILRFSIGHLHKLLTNGEIPYRLVGTHRRISATDLFNYYDKLEEDRQNRFNEISRIGQELEQEMNNDE